LLEGCDSSVRTRFYAMVNNLHTTVSFKFNIIQIHFPYCVILRLISVARPLKTLLNRFAPNLRLHYLEMARCMKWRAMLSSFSASWPTCLTQSVRFSPKIKAIPTHWFTLNLGQNRRETKLY